MGLILLSWSDYFRPFSRRFGFLSRPLVQPPGTAFQRFQAEQGALQARRGEGDPEVLDDVIAIDRLELVERLPAHLVGQDRGRRLRDRAALAAEAHVLDAIALADLQEHRDLVPAERVRVV